MLSFLKKRLVKCQKGAMDKILVTLLLVIVGVGAVAGLTTWLNTQSQAIQTSAATTVNTVTADAQNGSTN